MGNLCVDRVVPAGTGTVTAQDNEREKDKERQREDGRDSAEVRSETEGRKGTQRHRQWIVRRMG